VKKEKFKSGDKIVYPGHGVGQILEVQTKTFGGHEQQFYSIEIIESGMKVLVPVPQCDSVGIRKIIDRKTIKKVYDILQDRNFKVDTQTWNRRFREYSQKIKTGSVYEIAEVIRDLSVLKIDKELSFGEKKMLESAQNLLCAEIAIAKARSREAVIGEMEQLFAA
jgi:CarD family transcriptional regulator